MGLFEDMSVLDPNSKEHEELAEKQRGHNDQIYDEMKDAQYVELDTIEKCEAWIYMNYRSSVCLLQEPHGERFFASATDVGTFGTISAFAETPLLAIQSVVGQIIKWRKERDNQ